MSKSISAILLILFAVGSLGCNALKVGFYRETCPLVETVVRGVIEHKVAGDNGVAAVLLRLQFHDCFMQGCDGSILLTTEDDDEMLASGNAGVVGFQTIAEIKATVEAVCPGIVSCADIVVLAARDAVLLTNGPFYEVPTGRRDGRISKLQNTANLPNPEDSIVTLKSKFRDQGLSDRELVLLSAGAHTIGLTACFFVTPRLDAADPSISADFFKVLRTRCPRGGPVAVKIPMDWEGERNFDTHILQNIKSGRGVLPSDSVLYHDESTKAIIDGYLASNSSFMADFARAMVKLGSLGVKTGNQGEIRRFCNSTN